MRDLTELEIEMMEIDQRLRPISTRRVDITDPDWLTLLRQRPHPLDEAGVRPAAEVLLEALIDEYQNSDDETRSAIRGLFGSYPHFAWAASLTAPPTTDEAFRRHLVLFSMQDQGRDSRDALLNLQGLCKQARAAGVDTSPILREVARLSSDENKYGMGSTRRFLDNA